MRRGRRGLENAGDGIHWLWRQYVKVRDVRLQIHVTDSEIRGKPSENIQITKAYCSLYFPTELDGRRPLQDFPHSPKTPPIDGLVVAKRG